MTPTPTFFWGGEPHEAAVTIVLAAQVPAVVGGRAVSHKHLGEAAKEEGPQSGGGGRMDAKTATYGQKGHSATDLGKKVIENPTLQMERFGSAGRSGKICKVQRVLFRISDNKATRVCPVAPLFLKN